MKNRFDVEYVTHGIANRFSGNRIEIHQKLLEAQYKPLYEEILLHEMNHTDSGYGMEDLRLDVTGFKHKWLYRKFIITTPSSWVQFSPIYFSKGRFYFDISLIGLYAFAAVVIYATTRIIQALLH